MGHDHGVEVPKEKKAHISRAIERLGVYLWNNYIVKWEIGLLPREYNFKVHGPYVPYRYYGKIDTPFKDVKLGDMPAWLARRQKNPVALAQAVGRQLHYYQHRFRFVKYKSPVFYYQVIIVSIFFLYAANYERHVKYRHARYHW